VHRTLTAHIIGSQQSDQGHDRPGCDAAVGKHPLVDRQDGRCAHSRGAADQETIHQLHLTAGGWEAAAGALAAGWRDARWRMRQSLAAHAAFHCSHRSMVRLMTSWLRSTSGTSPPSSPCFAT
jgi:hypothetical protein